MKRKAKVVSLKQEISLKKEKKKKKFSKMVSYPPYINIFHLKTIFYYHKSLQYFKNLFVHYNASTTVLIKKRKKKINTDNYLGLQVSHRNCDI